ncbi:MAG TPA: OpcA/G6PD domain-containing protein [Candidatus Cybelea sp.]|nr:OpcA/G6PD domain-containing protein [Candidatus Cybelea sp.]
MTPTANVATMTIVVYFEDAAIGELARDRIRTLASKHPSRVILFDATADSERREEGPDWIEIGVKSAQPVALSSALAELRVREVPVVLLWIAPGIGDDERFCALAPDAQTIVYNSSLVHEGDEALRELVDYVARHPELALADIAYLRLAPWQESVAILFDGSDVAELSRLQRVEVTCGSEPEAFYLLGWLASRLNWSPGDPNTVRDRSGNPVEYAITREGEPRRIRRVALRSSNATFVAEVDRNGETIALRVENGGSHPQRNRAIEDPGIAALVERAILAGHHDRIFAESLAAAGGILSRRKEQP